MLKNHLYFGSNDIPKNVNRSLAVWKKLSQPLMDVRYNRFNTSYTYSNTVVPEKYSDQKILPFPVRSSLEYVVLQCDFDS